MKIDMYPMVQYYENGNTYPEMTAIVVSNNYGDGATLNVFTSEGVKVVEDVQEVTKRHGGWGSPEDYVPRFEGNAWVRMEKDI